MIYNFDFLKFELMQLCLSICQVAWIYQKFDLMIWQVIVQALIIQLTVFYLGYAKIYQSKVLYATQKKMHRMMKEQYLIVKNLPDGAMIHR